MSNAVQHIKVFKSWWSPKRELKDHRNYLKLPSNNSIVYRLYCLILKADQRHNSSLCLQDSRMPVRANTVLGRCWGVSVCQEQAAGLYACRCVQFMHLHMCPGPAGEAHAWHGTAWLSTPASTEVWGGFSFPASAEMWWGDFNVLLVESAGTFQAMPIGVFALFLAWNICLYKHINQCQFETYCSKPKLAQIWHYLATRN